MLKRLILFLLTATSLTATTGNFKEYSVETLGENLNLTTTERGVIVVSSSDDELLFLLSAKEKAQLSSFLGTYLEMDAVVTSNYRTNLCVQRRSYDFKLMLFTFLHISEEDTTIISIIIDPSANGLYKEEVHINLSLDQFQSLILKLGEGFKYIDTVRTEVIKLRLLESDLL